MKQFIIVSHRLSFTVKCRQQDSVERETYSTGLGTVLSRLVSRIDDSLWVGWLGADFHRCMRVPPVETAKSQNDSTRPIWADIDSHRIHPVFLGERLHRK